MNWGGALSYFLGVDGGGTKTTAIVTDEKGTIVARTVGESINYNSIGYEAAQSNMKDIVDFLMNKIDCDCFEGACIGMSAISEKSSQQDTENFFEGVIKCSHKIMDSDLAIAMEAMMCEGPCAMVISGTGSMVVGRDENGDTVHTGGWGYILGDEGSGYQLSIDALRAAITSFEKSSAESMLTQKMMDYYNVKDMHEIINVFYDPPMERSQIAKFVSVLFDCAKNNDEAAINIAKNQAKKLANTTIALLRQLPKNIKIGIWGGVFVHYNEYLNFFKNEIFKFDSGYQIEILKYPPEIGAVMYAMRESGRIIDENIISNLEKSLSGGN